MFDFTTFSLDDLSAIENMDLAEAATTPEENTTLFQEDPMMDVMVSEAFIEGCLGQEGFENLLESTFEVDGLVEEQMLTEGAKTTRSVVTKESKFKRLVGMCTMACARDAGSSKFFKYVRLFKAAKIQKKAVTSEFGKRGEARARKIWNQMGKSKNKKVADIAK